jgi:hypothetical protein
MVRMVALPPAWIDPGQYSSFRVVGMVVAGRWNEGWRKIEALACILSKRSLQPTAPGFLLTTGVKQEKRPPNGPFGPAVLEAATCRRVSGNTNLILRSIAQRCVSKD